MPGQEFSTSLHRSPSTDLVIAGITILQDEHGRYNLNALHQASECAERDAKKPSQWLRLKSSNALIAALEAQGVNSHPDVVVGGDRAGTYAHELLAVSYAGWISPAFQLKVNQAFIDVRMGRVQPMPTIHDHRTKVAIETLMRLDAAEYEIGILKAETAQAKDMALTAYQAQQWVTLRQYVAMHKLDHQLPEGSAQQRYGSWLVRYCHEHGLPIYMAHPIGKAWKEERTYPVWAIQQTLQAWLYRDAGQGPITGLDIREDGIAYESPGE